MQVCLFHRLVWLVLVLVLVLLLVLVRVRVLVRVLVRLVDLQMQQRRVQYT
jgi:hypothetical protein